jgi:hypothetical protein
MLHIEGKTLGQRKPLFAGFSVPPPVGGEITLRVLLGHVVRSEVDQFQKRQADRRLLHALTVRQIKEGLAHGKVDSGGHSLDQKVDVDEAVRNVIEAYQDGLFLVVLDETELKDLDAPLHLTEQSRLTFLRLSLLAGG